MLRNGSKPLLPSLILLLLLLPGMAGLRAAEGLEPVPVEEPAPTVVGFEDYYDPLEGLNRKIFAANDVLYRYGLIPLAEAYRDGVPVPVQTGVGRAFANLREPLHAVNHLLQARPLRAGRNLLRFGLNSTLGLLGLFDPAESWMEVGPAPTSLNETLMRYGVGRGAYLVMPLLGPSDVRNGLSTGAQSYLHPLRFLLESPEDTLLIGFDGFQDNIDEFGLYRDLREESDDPYLYFRNQYLQGVQRDEESLDGDEGE